MLVELKNTIDWKEVPKNQSPEKVVDIVEEILNFNKQQKGKGIPWDLAKVFDCRNLRILNPKQMLQR